MELHKDFKEFLQLLVAHKVEYLVVGAYSVAFHGFPRYTGDFDIWINPTSENAEKLINALAAFGFASLELRSRDFMKPDQVIQLGVEPLRIDILTSLSGVKSFSEAYDRRKSIKLSGLELDYISYHDLIANKKETGRLQDKRDIEELAKVKKKGKDKGMSL